MDNRIKELVTGKFRAWTGQEVGTGIRAGHVIQVDESGGVLGGSTNPVKVIINDIEDLTFSIDNTETHTFHNAATTTGNGTAYTVAGQKTLLISITGTNVSTSTVTFYGGNIDGSYTPLMGVRMSDFTTATSTSTVQGTTPENWQFDIRGFTTIRIPLTTLTGASAAVTVKGTSVG